MSRGLRAGLGATGLLLVAAGTAALLGRAGLLQGLPGMLLLQLGVYGGVCALAVRWMALRPDELRLRPPRAADLVLGLLLGLGLPGLAGGVYALQQQWWPAPPGYSEAMGRLLLGDGQPLWLLLVVYAVLPATIEELLGRGVLLGLLQRALGPLAAVVGSGLLFGLLHVDPPRLLPMAAVGIALGVAVLRSGSLLPAVLAHFLNNALTVTANYHRQGAPAPEGATGPSWPLLGLALLCLLAMGRLGQEPAIPRRADAG